MNTYTHSAQVVLDFTIRLSSKGKSTRKLCKMNSALEKKKTNSFMHRKDKKLKILKSDLRIK